MTNIFKTNSKKLMKNRLFEIGLEALKEQGWHVGRVQGIGKSSVRRITKGGKSQLVSIRTSQDTCIAFPRNKHDDAFETLSDVDMVLAVSVDDRHEPRFAQVHMIPADEMRERFDRAYRARKKSGYKLPLGRGIWVPLYDRDATDPVTHVGAGAGVTHPPIARVPLNFDASRSDLGVAAKIGNGSDEPLTIPEAKRRLALTLGVDPSRVKITVEA